ncbi:hypothetical protein FLK61_35895 [Paenalkalicoccus suaedae]|uniref:Uncharacterized protein n=1 Tax=Paenalkalicoccus suaedae TaxID=2592382 RepID=A0A859FGV5_9BACI|nr:hypothetical protein [Paenalkalicoccus suaedae]QKS72048.1 hypothetical protein FLK61_35895 [Paenalkalicoccus suaedae]
MKASILIIIIGILAGCSESSTSINTPSQVEPETVELILDNDQQVLDEIDYQIFTDEAVEVFNSMIPYQSEQSDQIRKWFIRYYIQMKEAGEVWSPDEMMTLAQERTMYEHEWKQLAKTNYEIELTEDSIEQQASYAYDLYQDSPPASAVGMANSLQLSLEDFFKEFDRDHAERTVIWKELYPILQAKYREEDGVDLDTVAIAQRYSEEVLESLSTRATNS